MFRSRWPTFSLVVLTLLTLLLRFEGSSACLCHVLRNYKCPPPPHCCESGQYTFDECGCCMKCAKAELQSCGGPSGSGGKCAKGLACLKTCDPCTTIGKNPEPCVFPFKYSGQRFDRCTRTGSKDPNLWCATEVDDEGDVISGRWGDCNEHCPGMRRECNDQRFSILSGKCINPAVPGAIPNWHGAPSHRLLEPTTDLFPAPLCKAAGAKARRKYTNTCRCAGGRDAIEISSDGKVRGNCTGDAKRGVWCFLENVRDPGEPKSGCYPDTTWSSKDGRFWSADACNGLPPLDDQDGFAEAERLSQGRKHPLFQAAINTPFQRPEVAFKPKKERKKTTTTTRSTTTTTTTTTLPPNFLVFDYDLLYEEYPDLLIGHTYTNIDDDGSSSPSAALALPIINIRDEVVEAILPTPIPKTNNNKAKEVTTAVAETDPPPIPTSKPTETITTTIGAAAVSNGTTVEGSLSSNGTTSNNATTESASSSTTENASSTTENASSSTTENATSSSSTSVSTTTTTAPSESTSSQSTTSQSTTTTTTVTQSTTSKVSTTATTTTSTTTSTVTTTLEPSTLAYLDGELSSEGVTEIVGNDLDLETETADPILAAESLKSILRVVVASDSSSLDENSFVHVVNPQPLTTTVSPPSEADDEEPRNDRTIDLGLFGTFWLQPSRSIDDDDLEEDDETTTLRPEPVFILEEHTDKYPQQEIKRFNSLN